MPEKHQKFIYGQIYQIKKLKKNIKESIKEGYKRSPIRNGMYKSYYDFP